MINIIKFEDIYLDKVKELLKEVAINEYGFFEWLDYFDKSKFLQLNSNRDAFWIALDEYGNIIGTIGITEYNEPSEAKLHSLYVKKEYRGKGVARELYSICEKFAKNNNYEEIVLHTYLKFSDAIEFYKRRGYIINNNVTTEDGMWLFKKIKNSNDKYAWNNYFANLRNKYNMRISLKKPLIINLDGKDTTKGIYFSLIDTSYENGFLNIMEKTVKYFSQKYNCISIFGADEVSFIIENPMVLIDEINSGSDYRMSDIISVFSQYFFEYFNSMNDKPKIYWHGKCFSIPSGKTKSFIKYKSTLIKGLVLTYFLKKNGISNAGTLKLEDKIEMCKKYDYYKTDLEELLNGILYYNGEKIDIEEFLKGNIKKIVPKETINKNNFTDLSDWDNL